MSRSAWDGVPVEGWDDVTLNGSPFTPHRRSGYLGALRVSDFLSQRELHRTRYYEVGLRPLGGEHSMEVEIPSPAVSVEDVLLCKQRAGL